jgi:hypothetical protein
MMAERNAIQFSGHQPQLFTGQKGRILELLLSNKGNWVPAYKLSTIALQYGARLLELRAVGYVIQNKTERVGRQVHGAFRLVACPGETESLSFAKGGR